jgi:hypothetical protein
MGWGERELVNIVVYKYYQEFNDIMPDLTVPINRYAFAVFLSFNT